ncbi:VWA domain-containing protein [Billgrantia azerbaijanica]|nr:VWA domain-containing protein [Halomonas azerbaijanica]
MTDYKGATVTFSNKIYDELGLPEQNSYIAYDSTGDILTRGFEYTNGTSIDRSVSQDRDWNSSAAGNSDDLLIGGPSTNILQSGDGNDFLFGGGGDDTLNGGNGTDTGVLTGDPVDYDIRLNDDGTWVVRHVRGDATEGTDTFANIEKVHFEGGETFDLERDGLTFQTDFAFVVDQTGSMFDDIDAVKASANGVIDALFAGGAIDARVGVVGFKDNTIGEPTQVVLPFTDQDDFADRQAAATAAINSLDASGGGDFPETAFDGLLTALDGSMGEWREGAGTKRVVLFTDASAKDSFLLPTVQALALDIGADISANSSEALGTFGSVDTFELSFEDAAARDPLSEGDILPPFEPSDDPVTPSGGTATVQIFTIFVETFIEPDPDFVEISESTGGDVLTAATPEEVVERLFEVISEDNGETITGTNKPDDLTGTDADDIISGGNAEDTLSGLDGADELYGENGDNQLFGDEGIDRLFGGRGNDFLDGGEGDDFLYGEQGDDTLTGGGGADQFWIEKSGGTETITDFTIGEDRIGVSGIKQVTGFGDIDIVQDGADAVLDFKGVQAVLVNVVGSSLSADDFLFA